jgi:hypothetical protein
VSDVRSGFQKKPISAYPRKVLNPSIRQRIQCEVVETHDQEESMAVSWNKDIDSALGQARAQHKPALVDFSAAPA